MAPQGVTTSRSIARVLAFDDDGDATDNTLASEGSLQSFTDVETESDEEQANNVREADGRRSPAAATDAGSVSTTSPNKAGSPRRSKEEERRQVWVDSTSCSSLCQLILADRSGEACSGRRVLPPAMYSEIIAPFLRFDTPQPNQLYAFGGRNQRCGPLDTVEMFDTWNGRWVTCPSMPTKRAGSAAAVLPDGRIMLIGGYNEFGIAEGILASCDVYNPYTEQWEQAAPLGRARWGHGAITLGNKVYVVGGCSLLPDSQPNETFMETLRCCEVYDPQSDSWSPAPPLQVARSGSRVVALGEHYMAAVGGCDDVFGRAETQPTVELFDTRKGQWMLLESQLAHPRTTAAIAAFDDRGILVVGGAPCLASAEVFSIPLPCDSAADQELLKERSKQITNMPEGRMGCQAAVVSLPAPGGSYPMTPRRCVVVVGGEACDESAEGEQWPKVRQFDTVPAYDIEMGSWREDEVIPAMAFERTAVALCVGLGHVMQPHL
mmetsp:Transcript_25706/g.59960  ORF Transcript_25706/g.59960 Transcript_25706/m.59960 type:complete len:492 (+) Transcript_25706:98-1573(+)|eukprot:CAMPEP_0178424718 /NCGR_PEP_ID=MMETSP0689_2-20121128/28356_1 /TAXON_ID=160604 /ORGANISM="Amphidinium massartii, Strain CS-259" /LENGTH=491 /DNA_ID=CAMNT_0020046367 /DNA_START=37 /DNA_END=1512 /DNA_ORIENTATION=+